MSLSDDDFAKLVSGKTQAQRLFTSGKLKVKGDVMKVSYVSLYLKDRPADGCLVGNQDGTRTEEGAIEGKVVKAVVYGSSLDVKLHCLLSQLIVDSNETSPN